MKAAELGKDATKELSKPSYIEDPSSDYALKSTLSVEAIKRVFIVSTGNNAKSTPIPAITPATIRIMIFL